ncbi:2-dehydropantoate 2-reductase [Halobacillus massiliensis]|uniref:2-dehydropantoate 2-reductase n=1 Tax=Halobacillus massiliensis TaxID=1926286 RepID=UPI0015C43875|nr:2-dehydropantoate 2-reductase [Halobacillus massiliensis]
MKIGILGGGSVGLLLSSYLSREHEVFLYVRSLEQKELIEAEGIICDNRTAHVNVLLSDELHKHSCDLMMITVKQYHLTQIFDLLPAQTPLLFLQNGMAHLSLLEKLKNPCAVGVVEHGALKIAMNQVSHTGKGSVQMAVFKGEADVIGWAQLISKDEFPFYSCGNYYYMLSRKLIINTVINPLTAIFQVKNAHIIENPHIRFLAHKLCQEASIALNLDNEEQWERITNIAENTGSNHSSMYKDILCGRKTEIEAISGYIFQILNEQAPFHEFVIESIRALEEKNRKGERL